VGGYFFLYDRMTTIVVINDSTTPENCISCSKGYVIHAFTSLRKVPEEEKESAFSGSGGSNRHRSGVFKTAKRFAVFLLYRICVKMSMLFTYFFKICFGRPFKF